MREVQAKMKSINPPNSQQIIHMTVWRHVQNTGFYDNEKAEYSSSYRNTSYSFVCLQFTQKKIKLNKNYARTKLRNWVLFNGMGQPW